MISGLFMRPKMLQRTYSFFGTVTISTIFEQASRHSPPGIYNITVNGAGGGGGGMDQLYPARPGGYGSLGSSVSFTEYIYQNPKMSIGGSGAGGTNYPNLTNGGNALTSYVYERNNPSNTRFTLSGGVGGPRGYGGTASANVPINPLAAFGSGAYYTGSGFLHAAIGRLGIATFKIIG